MKCPSCNGDVKVVDSRPNNMNWIRRRRECLSCGERFSTVEMIIDEMPAAEIQRGIMQLQQDSKRVFNYLEKLQMKRSA